MIPKLPAQIDWKGPIPVNLESGNFSPPHLTHIDDQIDAYSDNPGEQRFEKAVSGAYLGRIFKAAFPDSRFDPASGSRGVSEIAAKGDKNDEQSIIAGQILERSSKLVAASLAGLIKVISRSKSLNSVRIVAEGSLIWGAEDFADVTRTSLDRLLSDLGLTDIRVDLCRIDNANLIGSAIAALVKS